MALTYRGVDFQPNLLNEVSPGQIGGKYRGLDWRFRNWSKPAVVKTNLDLLYRGTLHQTQSTLKTQTVTEEGVTPAPVTLTTPDPLTSVESLARVMMLGHQHALKIRQQAMLERAAEEVGLKADIGSHWDRIQGKVHPSFRESYDRSPATMS
ncbi:MAG: DUF4278 domain-containing protein [Synechococcaceae cyanobacterium SM2_3_1]|nr:DUF4278 domain-containing protein [Synechococcaceae cyanobacterium SM2_3_1]